VFHKHITIVFWINSSHLFEFAFVDFIRGVSQSFEKKHLGKNFFWAKLQNINFHFPR